VRLCEYNPLGRLSTLFGGALHLRDHRKLMLVDGRVGFIGGVNISGVYAVGSAGLGATRSIRRSGWRDTHVRVEGPVVAGLQRLFVRHWRRYAHEPLHPAHYFPPLPVCGEHRVAVAASEAGGRRNPFYRALLAAIEAARDRILLTGAYFVPTRRLLRALARAAARRVDVRIVLPGISDCWAPLHAGRSHYGTLLRAGVRIFERHDTLLHAKTCVIDGVWATIGSSNFDWRSFLHNAEANIVVLDAAFAGHIERVFADDVAHAREVRLDDWLHRGRLPRVKEWLARRVEFFL
jgi:cardiolipin synthase